MRRLRISLHPFGEKQRETKANKKSLKIHIVLQYELSGFQYIDLPSEKDQKDIRIS